MCGGEKYFSSIPYSTYDLPRELQWIGLIYAFESFFELILFNLIKYNVNQLYSLFLLFVLSYLLVTRKRCLHYSLDESLFAKELPISKFSDWFFGSFLVNLLLV